MLPSRAGANACFLRDVADGGYELVPVTPSALCLPSTS
jgi:hypothetical protein